MTTLTAPVQLSSHFYILYSEYPHCDSGNVYLVTGEHPTLIDCGSRRSVSHTEKNLHALGMSVLDIEQIIATHGDCDHVQGFPVLKLRNPLLHLHIHRGDWPAVQGTDMYRNAGYLYGLPCLPIMPDDCLPLESGDVITSGDSLLTVIHTPGHTEGSICLHGRIDGQTVLFAGDCIGGAMHSLDGAVTSTWVQSFQTWKHSLAVLSALRFDWILNGHEPAATLPIARAAFDRMVPSFGMMMNPWFSLSEADFPEPELIAQD